MRFLIATLLISIILWPSTERGAKPAASIITVAGILAWIIL